MKTSVRKEAHTGEQPIRVLKHNIMTRLVERNEEFIKLLQSDYRLNSGIKYHIANLSLNEKQTPYIDSKGVINIHETYLSYVWIVCYGFFVIHEEGLAIPDRKKRGLLVHKEQNLQLVDIAKELFNYGKSIIASYYPWDTINFPNPEYFDESTEEGWYILRTKRTPNRRFYSTPKEE